MATEDETRRELFELLDTGFGSRGAALLMTYLPPTGWTELATRRDLDALRAELQGEMAGLRGETAGLRGELAELRDAMAELRGELKGEMRAMVPKLWAANVASMIGLAGIVLAAGAAL